MNGMFMDVYSIKPKKERKFTVRNWILGTAGFIFLVFVIVFWVAPTIRSRSNFGLLGVEAPVIQVDGVKFRDLNKNGLLDVYEDSRQPVERRVDDLLGQMSLDEKAGMMYIPLVAMNKDGSYGEMPDLTNPLTLVHHTNSETVARLRINHLLLYDYAPPSAIARWNDNIQKMAERTRLGIPVTIGANSLNMAVDYPGSNIYMGSVSHWPFPIGMAAARDTALMRTFGEMARQEYLAMGIRLNLNPLADLATEPRWGKVNSTFGEDAVLSAQLVRAYIQGFQGDSVCVNSVACMVKHFPGGGPLENGEDSHFPYGKFQVYPGGQFDYHLIPFKAAFAVNVSRVMPYYSIPQEKGFQKVGFAFNKSIISGLLQERLGFKGIVCTDWNLIEQQKVLGVMPLDPPKSWGVEGLTDLEKTRMIIDAGCDQFGGEDSPELIVELVKKKMISEERINISVRKLLREKFKLGLFDNPYVSDYSKTDQTVGQKRFVEAGKVAQRKSLVLLKNGLMSGQRILPIRKRLKVYSENIDRAQLAKYGEVTENLEDADLAILKLDAPFEPRNKYLLELYYRQGSLAYSGDERGRLIKIMRTKPTVLCMFLDRPAVIPEIVKESRGFIAQFGIEDGPLLDVVFGVHKPTGKLPFEMPASLEAVEQQKEDTPYDSEQPLFPFGFGLSYEPNSISQK